MQAVEFETFLAGKTIEVPAELSEKIKGRVRVIILHEVENAADNSDADNYLDYLMQNPLKIPDFKPMTRDEIYSGKRFGD